MGIIFAIFGLLALLVILIAAVTFWFMAMVTFMAFVSGGFLAIALGGDQNAFYIGGFFTVLITWAGLGIYTNLSEKKSE